MTVIIDGIKISGTTPTHETITNYHYAQTDPAKANWMTKAAMVDWVEKHPEVAFCTDANGKNSAYVYVVPNNNNPYLRTKKDGVWGDNLLAQPISK
jgi:Protein of unknown function (DUF3892)